MKKTNLYVAHGGTGICVSFSSLIDTFSERDNDKISIACGFPEVFKFHPKINSAPQWTGGDLRHDIAEYFDDIIFREPYVSQYAKRDRHIVKEWARLFGFELETDGKDMQPDFVVNPQWTGEADKIYDKFIKEKFIMLQFTGGQPADNHYVNKKQYTQNAMTQGRNLQNYYDVMLALGEEYKSYKFFLYALPNEPIQIPPELQKRCLTAQTNAMVFAALVNKAETFLAIDSSLHHFAASRQYRKKGVVIWGTTTTPTMIGHNLHINMQSLSPTEIKVEPKDVIDNVHKVLTTKKQSKGKK